MSDDGPMAETAGHDETLPEPLGADDPRTHLASAVAVARVTVGAITPEDHDTPTSCGALSVAELAEHLVMALRNAARAGRGEPPTEWPYGAPDVPTGEWEPALADAAHQVQAAWDDATVGRTVALPWGEFPGRQVLGIYTNEVIVHTWELARATGQVREWDPAAIAFADRAIHEQLPVADRTEMWAAFREQIPPEIPWEDPFGPAVDVPEDAPAIDRLVAWNGRTP